ncbi:hypothetical protein J4229_00305 [Candidatus Pacearchaeota archaeon]|nr:hypothetical protein [Candidatus Pacearchaeota archaeon]
MDKTELVGFTSENLKKAHESGKEIILTNEDKKSMYGGFQKFINKSSENITNFKFLLFGTGLGIIGSFISQAIYEAIKESGTNMLFLSISISAVIFVLLVVGIILNILHHKNEIKDNKNQQEIWSKAKSLRVG